MKTKPFTDQLLKGKAKGNRFFKIIQLFCFMFHNYFKSAEKQYNYVCLSRFIKPI